MFLTKESVENSRLDKLNTDTLDGISKYLVFTCSLPITDIEIQFRLCDVSKNSMVEIYTVLF